MHIGVVEVFSYVIHSHFREIEAVAAPLIRVNKLDESHRTQYQGCLGSRYPNYNCSALNFIQVRLTYAPLNFPPPIHIVPGVRSNSSATAIPFLRPQVLSQSSDPAYLKSRLLSRPLRNKPALIVDLPLYQ